MSPLSVSWKNATPSLKVDAAFAPAWIPGDRVHEIPPSIDPFAPKNQPLTGEEVEAILMTVGLLAGPARDGSFERPDGTRRRITRGADVMRTGPAPDPAAPMVVQVSRWDYLKDMAGVMSGFADLVVQEHDSQLVLAGLVVVVQQQLAFKHGDACAVLIDKGSRSGLDVLAKSTAEADLKGIAGHALGVVAGGEGPDFIHQRGGAFGQLSVGEVIDHALGIGFQRRRARQAGDQLRS